MAANSKPNSTPKRWVQRVLLSIIAAQGCMASLGCADGPMFQLKKISPWHRREWKRDRELGPTYSQRIAELNLLETQLATMSPPDQEKWGLALERIVTTDTSSEMRARAAQVLALSNSDVANRGLNAASTDDVEKVRLAVCHAWGTRKDEHARDMLLSLAKTDDSDDVRQAALSSLGKFDGPEVRQMLVESLDHKNPAIQQQAVVSLKTITGRDFGGDFDAWKRLVQGEPVTDPEPVSLTARVMQSIPWTK